METKANYVFIGAATVIGVALIMLFAMWISSGEFNRGFNTYDVVTAGDHDRNFYLQGALGVRP